MMMDETMNLPHGFRFNPFEEELISFYLKPKVLGQKLPCNVVEEKQLYGPNADPWQLFHPQHHPWILSEVSSGKFEKVTYVFVNLTKKSAAGVDRKKNKNAAAATLKENYTKKAGCGTWDGQTKRSQIRDRITGKLIGEKRFLVFEINDVSAPGLDLDLSKVGYWKMHEFHLCGVNEDIDNPNNIVLCKITLDYSKTPPFKSRNKNNHDQPIKSASKPQKRKNTNMDYVSSPSTVNTVDGNQGAQTHRDDDSLVLDSCRVEEKQGDDGNDIVQSCDPMECMTSDFGKENILVIADSPSQVVNTQPAKADNEYQNIKKKVCGRGGFLFGMTKDQFCRSYTNSKEEQSVEDITTNPGKRKKNKVETSSAMSKKLCP